VSEQAKDHGVIGDGAREANKAAMALERCHPRATQPEKARDYQTKRTGPDDRDLAFSANSARTQIFQASALLPGPSRCRL
jgi:hypothetical protein